MLNVILSDEMYDATLWALAATAPDLTPVPSPTGRGESHKENSRGRKDAAELRQVGVQSTLFGTLPTGPSIAPFLFFWRPVP